MTEPTITELGWDDISEFPGVYHLGSDGEKALLGYRKFQEEDGGQGGFVRNAGPLVRHGLVSQDHRPSWSDPLSTGAMENDRVAKHHDVETLVEVDKRLRWCRCALDRLMLPYDREPVVVFQNDERRSWGWRYQSELDEPSDSQDPLDCVLMRVPSFSTGWFAAKILAHNRRAERIMENETIDQLQMMSLGREFMLFGETWGEAKFIINHSDVTISGQKQAAGRLRGAEMTKAANSKRTRAVLDEMSRLLASHPKHGVKWAGVQAHKNGFGSSSEANRKAWHRSKK
ncbi:MAG: hypothetical protein H0T56_03930 [Pseudaminobacter sp.]|nr:hypothetical protein [Pseudaminobacter sp.]